MSDKKLVPLFAYQGGKTRLANKILDFIGDSLCEDTLFVDLCCGGGSVSLELVNRGHNPHKIVMLDSGAMGAFWSQIGKGEFDLDWFEDLCETIPSDPKEIQGFMKKLSRAEYTYVGERIAEYLLLQASSFGGKQITDNNGKFGNTSFRSYWEPTPTSSRRSPVNPMMPMPATLKERLYKILKGMLGVNGTHGYVQDVDFEIFKKYSEKVVVYIDPPYEGTTGYKDDFDLQSIWTKAKMCGCDVYISEYKPLSDNFIVLSSTKKGGISGERVKGEMVEYLSRM